MSHFQGLAVKSPQNRLTWQDLVHKLDKLGVDATDTELQLVELKTDEVLFNQGDEGNSMYVLVAGALGVRVRQPDGTETVIDKLAPGAVVGELALLSGQRRTATVYAVNDAGLICLSRGKFERLTAEEQSELLDIDTTIVARWQRLQLSKVLGNLFGELDAGSLHILQEQLEWHHLSNGDILFHQDDAADGMYIVVNGRLRFTAVSPDGETTVTNEVGPGETIGEYALLTNEVRSATVYAVRETNLVKMTPTVFAGLVRQYPQLMVRLTRIIVERQQRTLKQTKPVAPASLTLTLLPASPHVDIAQFAQELAIALMPYGASLTLDSRQFEQQIGQEGAAQTTPDAPNNPAIVAMMDELEANNKYLLYIADAEPSAWTRRCIGQADRVLLVADPQQEPTPGAVEHMLAQLEVPVHTELVLWHPAETEWPSGTAAWLDARQVHAHHHVRKSATAHMERLARRVSGHAIALVFSGGGALAYAQMGVYKTFLDLNIPIDYVGGTSMGAIMAGGIVREYSYETIKEMAQWTSDFGVFDYTLPLASLTASKHVTQICQRAFGGFEIEDLWLPFFCMATSLSLAEPVIQRRGSMWRAVRASMSIPGVFLPVVDDGNVLVDGGIMDNFPVEVMAALCQTERIIGVHINPYKERKREYHYDTSLSGWRILFNRLNPFSKRLRTPSLAATMMQAVEINGVRISRSQEEMVDLMIHPNVKKFSITDYSKWKEISQVGYDAALEPLREWKKQQSDI